MRIGFVGGVERNEADLRRIARAAGHEVEVHPGHTGGRGTAAIERVVARCDVVLILVEVNSHGAVHTAKRTAQKYGRPAIVLRHCGPARFERLLAELSTPVGLDRALRAA
ncbi:MAG: DUF2325 domain-containing protein [Deltaproteobacteria bacterium]